MNWWTNQYLLNGTTCVMSDIATALNRSLAVNPIPIQNGNIDGVRFNTNKYTASILKYKYMYMYLVMRQVQVHVHSE